MVSWICGLCVIERVFKTKRGLFQHIRRVHPQEPPPQEWLWDMTIIPRDTAVATPEEC